MGLKCYRVEYVNYRGLYRNSETGECKWQRPCYWYMAESANQARYQCQQSSEGTMHYLELAAYREPKWDGLTDDELYQTLRKEGQWYETDWWRGIW